MGPITIDISLAVTFLGLVTAIGTALWQIHKLAVRFERLEKRSDKRKADNEKILKSLLACLDGLHQKGCNGIVTQTLKELQEYIVESR